MLDIKYIKENPEEVIERLRIKGKEAREEIEQIEVRLPGGLVELTKRVVAAEGNGIIFEMTAKPGTRFYIHHDKFGDSNEVTISPEGNKEYRIDAQLNILLSMVVS